MGASNRNSIFAAFIIRNFGKCKSVLVVADGKGELAALLAKRFKVRVIEAKPRQKVMRKRVNYKKGWFTKDSAVTEDLIVGMHPDEATWPIIAAAKKNKKRWAVVPCCIKGGIETHGVKNYHGWINKLIAFGRPCKSTTLPMNGKNIVIWGDGR